MDAAAGLTRVRHHGVTAMDTRTLLLTLHIAGVAALGAARIGAATTY